MKVSISNYRGISTAVLDVSKIALIAGKNGAGKSSACQAFAAVLTGEPVPLEGVTKNTAGVLVRSGTAAGKVELGTDNGYAEITWPGAKVKTTGEPPCASTFAVGLESIVTMDSKKRVPFLIDYLKANPSKDQLQKSLQDLPLNWGIPDGQTVIPAANGRPQVLDGKEVIPQSPTIDKLWELIQTIGWDGAHGQIKDKGAKLKGQWEYITNDNYGAKKAENWIPQGWDSSLDGASEDTLKGMVTDARDELEAAIAANAVDESKRADLAALAAQLPDRQKALSDAKTPLLEDQDLKKAFIALTDAQNKHRDATNKLDRLRKEAPKAGDPPKKLYCVCGKELMLDPTGNLCEYTTSGPTQDEINAHGKKVSDAIKEVNELAKDITPLEEKHRELTAVRKKAVDAWEENMNTAAQAVTAAREAKQELDEMPPASEKTGGDVEACREALNAHELRLKAFTAKRDADRIAASIELNQKLLGYIAPGGVRAEVLQQALGGFNRVLANLCETASWATVTIEGDFSFSYGGTPYYLLAESEKWRVRTAVQLAMAKQERAAAVICDGADILDKGGRNGLFKLLATLGIPALVGMTIDAMEHVPQLARTGYGYSYWINGAVVTEVG